MTRSSASAFEVLRNRDYALLWIGANGSVLGSTMLQLARGYIAYDLTGSAAALGFVTLAQGVPMLFLALLGGVVADRVKKRPLLLFTQSSLAIIGLVSALVVHTGIVEIWMLAVLSLLQGAVFSFNLPTRQAYMIELVGPSFVARAVGLNNASASCMSILGPTMAGFLIAASWVGTTGALYIITAVYLVPVLMLFLIKTKPPEQEHAAGGYARDFIEGFQYISRHPVLRMIVLAGIVAIVVGSPYSTLLPVFASEDVLDVGASGLGLMSMAVGVGALFGALTVASLSDSKPPFWLQASMGVAYGLALMVFSLMGLFPAALASLVFVGLASSGLMTLNSTLAIGASEPAFYGRVSSIQQVNWSLASLFTLPIGIAVDAVGVQPVVLVAGAVVAAFFLLIGIFSPNFRLAGRESKIETLVVERVEERMESPVA